MELYYVQTPQPLNLTEALKLYDVLAIHLPEDIDTGADTLAFIGKVVDNIIKSGKPRDFITAIEIMYKISVNDILKLSKDEAIIAFAQGLIENKILDLRDFCKRLNYDGRTRS